MSRYYVIINGVNSLTIEGLAIKNLPSIIKAPQRTLREEIDGRDGDIITNLGYGAYDKTLEIGLFGNYDIDKVIEFFNTEGTIVFSDEDDKVYNFKMLEQINYDKLIKFRQATITLHIQPFKYPLNETPVEIEYEYVNGEGEDISLDNTGISSLDINLKGNTSQTGTPTPTTPVNVNVVSGDNEVVVCGKNLIDNTNITYDFTNVNTSENTLTAIPTGIRYSCSRTSGTPTVLFKLFELTPYIGKTIKMKATFGSKGQIRLAVVNADVSSRVQKAVTTDSNTEITYVVENNLGDNKYLAFYLALQNVDSATTVDFTNLILTIDEDTTYQPYQSQTYSINLGTIELCKIGTYQDYIYKDSGKWYLHKEIGKVVLNGSEGWQVNSSSTNYYRYVATISDSISSSNTDETIYTTSNYFVGSSAKNTIITNPTQNLIAIVSNNRFMVNTIDSNLFTNSNFQNWLSNHNTTVYYVLATSTNTEITDTNLISNLDDLEGAMSYTPQTNISQTNNDKPFILTVSALKKGTNEATINNLGNIYSKPILDIEGTGVVDIYLNGTQVFQVDTSSTNEIVIDSANMEAYDPNTNDLANRKVVGDYETFKVPSGTNTIKCEGALTKATISKYTRWL